MFILYYKLRYGLHDQRSGETSTLVRPKFNGNAGRSYSLSGILIRVAKFQ